MSLLLPTTVDDPWLMCGDCLHMMDAIPDNSVDMVLADPPYGTTACKWDTIIPLKPMWEQLKRITKPNAAIVFTASQPFTTMLIASNYEMFKYCWVWEKGRASGHVHAKNKPLKAHEDICVFSIGVTVHKSQSNNRMTYNPIMDTGRSYIRKQKNDNVGKLNHAPTKSNLDWIGTTSVNDGTRYPRSVVYIQHHNVGNTHPTEKPIRLFTYMTKTYSNPNDTVLDPFMGSGTTGVACIANDRKFIGIELDPTYFQAARKRILSSIEKPWV